MTKTHTKSSLFAIFAMTSILLLSPSMTSTFATNHLIYADDVVEYNPTLPFQADRQHSERALDEESTSKDFDFVSLGLGGSITLGFENPVGGTLYVFEATYGSGWNEEKVEVFVSSDNITYESIGFADNQPVTVPTVTSILEIPEELGCISYVKLVDVSTDPRTGPDYFDVDAVGISGDVNCTTTVDIDIKPGSDPSSWNCKNTKGGIPVAVFSTPDFDAATIDLSTLTIDRIPVSEVHEKKGEPKRHLEDKNGDGLDDAILHLGSAEVCEAAEDIDLKQTGYVLLEGSTIEGDMFEGIGDIRIVKR